MTAVRRGASDTLQFAVAASVLLFWLQALRVMFAVMFGIVYDQTRSGPVGPWLFISSLLVLTSLIAPGRRTDAAVCWALTPGWRGDIAPLVIRVL